MNKGNVLALLPSASDSAKTSLMFSKIFSHYTPPWTKQMYLHFCLRHLTQSKLNLCIARWSHITHCHEKKTNVPSLLPLALISVKTSFMFTTIFLTLHTAIKKQMHLHFYLWHLYQLKLRLCLAWCSKLHTAMKNKCTITFTFGTYIS